jgi:hypothetical protein
MRQRPFGRIDDDEDEPRRLVDDEDDNEAEDEVLSRHRRAYPRCRRPDDDEDDEPHQRHEDDDGDPYQRAVNQQRRKREGLPPGRELHYREREVAAMIDGVNEYRGKAEHLARRLQSYVADDKELQTRYDKFIASGGITGKDFAAIMRGESPRRVKRRGNLRLVHVKKSVPRLRSKRS